MVVFGEDVEPLVQRLSLFGIWRTAFFEAGKGK